MTTVSLQLDEELLETTHPTAQARHATVDDVDDVVAAALQRAASELSSAGNIEERVKQFDAAISRLGHFDTGGPYTR